MKEVITMMPIITIIIMDPYMIHFYLLASEHRNLLCDSAYERHHNLILVSIT